MPVSRSGETHRNRADGEFARSFTTGDVSEALASGRQKGFRIRYGGNVSVLRGNRGEMVQASLL